MIRNILIKVGIFAGLSSVITAVIVSVGIVKEHTEYSKIDTKTADVEEMSTEKLGAVQLESNIEDTMVSLDDYKLDEEYYGFKTIDMDVIYQYPELPAGCESVALTMMLKYYGYTELEKTTIAEDYLEYSDYSFVQGFLGDPFDEEIGGGCYLPGMLLTANTFLQANESELEAVSIHGAGLEELLSYVSKDIPVMVWSTIENEDNDPSGDIEYFDGTEYEWDYNEHCVVLTGYDLDNNLVQLNDSISGIYWTDIDRFMGNYNNLGSMAMIIR